MKVILQNRDVPLYINNKYFSENFCPVCDSLVSAGMDI